MFQKECLWQIWATDPTQQNKVEIYKRTKKEKKNRERESHQKKNRERERENNNNKEYDTRGRVCQLRRQHPS